jgi:hypothetical protein
MPATTLQITEAGGTVCERPVAEGGRAGPAVLQRPLSHADVPCSHPNFLGSIVWAGLPLVRHLWPTTVCDSTSNCVLRHKLTIVNVTTTAGQLSCWHQFITPPVWCVLLVVVVVYYACSARALCVHIAVLTAHSADLYPVP